ncbi:YeeE/YedE family protein [Falsiroseomonas bella]|uniref:YeeE/YedE family protein n=1 Tax=Falsiroseomonas bella TaxID=2184016 RepID=A0A317F929_9PROT|nr:YeeE/YedE thiosulfate transporter family protein [Falsiroseomonas bella]PWS35650.1 YeeE/YedE family protein [Falsiroseomonas bella]
MRGAAVAPPARASLGVLALGVAAVIGITAMLPALPDPALPGVFIVALLLGAAFVRLDFGFAGGFRALLEGGDGRAVAASFVIPAIAAAVILPVAALAPGHGRFVAPIGLPLLLGAFVFGIGMQIANGCGSGVLVAAGQGSRRMWVALPFFCLGGVIGSLLLPMGLALPGFGTVDLLALLGPWGALLVVEAVLALGALALLRGARPEAARLRAGVLIGVLVALLFLVSGMPWGITTGLALWGAKVVQALGFELSATAFWMEPWAAEALRGPLLAVHSSLADIGLLLGALLAAAAGGGLRHGAPLGRRGAVGAALGGLLMGIGTRLSFGCNVGAFIGGVGSASLHGFVWFLAVLPGCWIGIRLRPLFGLPRR